VTVQRGLSHRPILSSRPTWNLPLFVEEDTIGTLSVHAGSDFIKRRLDWGARCGCGRFDRSARIALGCSYLIKIFDRLDVHSSTFLTRVRSVQSLGRPYRLERVASVEMTLDLDSVVEVVFQAVFERDNGAALRRLCDNSNFEQTLIDELVVIGRIFLARVEQVHLEGEQRELELTSDEGESL